MKLHLPKSLQAALMGLAASVSPLALTVATASSAVSLFSISFAKNVEVNVASGDNITTGPANLASGDTLTVNMADASEGSQTSATWGVQITTNNVGASINVGQYATLTVEGTKSAGGYAVFARGSAKTQEINLASHSTLNTSVSLAGWTKGDAATVVNMKSDSTWNIQSGTEYMNKTKINMNGATINIDSDNHLNVERADDEQNFINVFANSGTSTITGKGSIILQNHQLNFGVEPGEDGIAADDTATTPTLSIAVAIEDGNRSDKGIAKTGNSILELTSADSTYSGDTTVDDGTLRLAGVGGKAGAGEITVAEGATLELAHTKDCITTNAITLNGGNLLVSGGNAETLSGNITVGGNLTVNRGTLNLGGTIRLQNGIVINDGGAVNVTQTAMIDLTDLRVSQISNGYTYYIGAGVNVHTDTRWSLPGGTYDQTSGLYTVVFNHTVTNNSDFRWGSANAGDDNGQAIPADSLVRFAGNTSINMAANVSVMLMEIAEGAKVTYTPNNHTLSVKGKLLLNGSLSLLDTWTPNTGGSFNNGNGGNIQFVVGTNGKLIADWGVKTDGVVTSARRVNGHPLLADYHGDLIVKDGASCLTAGERTFRSVTVESGGQFGINGTHTGDITISGNGTKAMSDMNQDYLGALKFCNSNNDGSVLIGNVYVRGGSATISAWSEDKGKISGTINGEDGHSTIIIRNGYSDTGNGNIIKVSGGLRGISVADVQQGRLELLSEGTISDFGDTFTKRGAGTLKIAKTGAMNGGHFVIDGGTVSLGDAATGGTAILKQAEVTVKGGATLTIGHDALGWGGNEFITKLLTLQGGSQTNRALLHNTDNNSNTLKTVINMNGHSRIENASGSTGKVNTLAGFRLNVTGTDNEIATEIQVRDGFVVDISNTTGSGELTISGKISTRARGDGGGLTKTGGGTLILTNTGNDVSQEVAILGGTLKLNGAGVKHGAGTLNMDRDTILEVAAGSASTTLENTISGSGDLKVSSGTLKLSGTSAVSLDTIHVSDGAGMVIDGTTKTVNVMGTICSDGTLTVNGSIVMNNADHLEGVVSADGTDGLFSDGANGTYLGGVVYVVKGNSVASKSDRLGGTGTITIGTDTYYITPGENQVSSDNFAWDQTTGVLTYDYQSATHETGAYYINTDVTYGEGHTSEATKLILNGGTLTITSATSLGENVNVEAQSDSTLCIDAKATVESARITEGRSHVRLAGSGTYTISGSNPTTAPNLEVTLGANWQGIVELSGTHGGSLGINTFANENSKVRLVGVCSWLQRNINVTRQLILENGEESYGLKIHGISGNADEAYTFSGKISGTGILDVSENTGTEITTATFKITGDISGWTGAFVRNATGRAGRTLNLEFGGSATTINAAVRNHGVADAANTSTLAVTINNDRNVTAKGAIERKSTGTLTLTTSGNGAKTFGGAVNVSKVTLGGGAVTFSQDVTLSGTVNSALNTDVTLNGKLFMDNGNAMTIAAGKTLTHEGFTYTAGSVDGRIAKTGDSAIEGENSAANIVSALYSTGTTVSGVTMTKTATSGDKTVNFALHNVHFINEGGTTTLNHEGNRLSTLEVSGGTVQFGADATLSGLTGTAADGAVKADGGARTLTIDQSSHTEFAGAIANGDAEAEVLGITKENTGTLTLSGANTYTGATAVTDGKLKVTGSIGNTSSVAVSDTGVLEISGSDASVTAGGITARANSANPGTAKKVTIGASGIAGTTSTNADGTTLQELGEMSDMTLDFAAANTAADIRNVTMQDVTLVTGGTVTYTNVKAVAASTRDAAVSPVLYAAATSSDTPQTLTAMAVLKDGTASGTLTIDVTSDLLKKSFGKDLEWKFLDQVTLGDDFRVELGDILKGIVSDGLPKVYLTVGGGERTKLTTENFDDICITTAAGAGGLLSGTTGAVDVTLTIENVPEPTTGTLSVLALAALAARRRRRE